MAKQDTMADTTLPEGVAEIRRTKAADFFEGAVFVAEVLLSGVASAAWRMWRAGRLD